jgi:early secretory antigenic target protein ESAT-6
MTESGHLSVNFVRLLETSSHIQKAIGALESQLDQLEQAAAPLVRTWSGEAQQAYQERQATWRQASADLARMLDAIKRGLDESMADYQGTEKYNVGLFTR